MINRLDELLNRDRSGRWKIILLSALSVAIWGYISEVFSKLSVDKSQIGATMVGILTFVLQILYYCWQPRTKPIEAIDKSSNRLRGKNAASSGIVIAFPRRIFFIAGTTATGILLFVIGTPVVGAALIDQSLRALARSQELLPEQTAKVAGLLGIASTARIKLPAHTLILLRDAIVRSDPNQQTGSAANALVEYGEETFPARIDHPRNDAERAYLEGAAHLGKAYANYPNVDRSEVDQAISALARCIDSPEVDLSLKTEALLQMANLYLKEGKPAEALASAKNAERLGSTDLSWIIDIETAALLATQSPRDWERAVSLATLGLQIKPPKWVSPIEALEYPVDLLHNRALAYSLLGEFDKSISDFNHALSITPKAGIAVFPLYVNLVRVYLKMGNVPQAEETIREWIERTHDPVAERVLAIVQSNRSDPQKALAELKNVSR